jgi:hypothetical protein
MKRLPALVRPPSIPHALLSLLVESAASIQRACSSPTPFDALIARVLSIAEKSLNFFPKIKNSWHCDQ